MPQVREDSLLLLDACCIINLFATNYIEDILGKLPYTVATSRLISEKEILSIARLADSDDQAEREVLSLRPLESSRHLSVLDLEDDREFAEFIQFASELDEGEASVCALAVVRGGIVATDDRKALRVLSRRAPHVSTVQTPELLYEWAQISKMPKDALTDVLRAVHQRARFSPRRDAPQSKWWRSITGEE
jgi:hypothetical protein